MHCNFSCDVLPNNDLSLFLSLPSFVCLLFNVIGSRRFLQTGQSKCNQVQLLTGQFEVCSVVYIRGDLNNYSYFDFLFSSGQLEILSFPYF